MAAATVVLCVELIELLALLQFFPTFLNCDSFLGLCDCSQGITTTRAMVASRHLQ
jgi:hypothetical protein